MPFQDHFSTRSATYAQFRPGYPPELFNFVAGLCKSRGTAWDCATGNGQAAVGIADYFDQVIATDASAAQIGHAEPHPRIQYRVALAEQSALPNESVDLVTVAQAVHWLDLKRFYAEVRRVLVPEGALAFWSYGDPNADDAAIDAELQRFTFELMGPYWPRERLGVGDKYRDLPFPFAEVATPSITLRQMWTLPEAAGYLRTWSAVAAYRQKHDVDPVDQLESELGSLWGGADTRHEFTWPLTMRAGYAGVGG